MILKVMIVYYITREWVKQYAKFKNILKLVNIRCKGPSKVSKRDKLLYKSYFKFFCKSDESLNSTAQQNYLKEKNNYICEGTVISL